MGNARAHLTLQYSVEHLVLSLRIIGREQTEVAFCWAFQVLDDGTVLA